LLNIFSNMPLESDLIELSKVLNCLVENTVNPSVKGINTDTRTLESGQVFLALRGEQFDGHNFLGQAFKQGAVGLIIEKSTSVTIPANIPILAVDNTLLAYQKIAQWWREKLALPVIAVTGSVGKTTSKEMVAALLGTQGRVHKTTANYNNEIGVPKTLLDLAPQHDYAVIELGMRGRGEIAQLTQIARPDLGIITNVGTAHIGRLGSETAIAQAKCELLEQMPPESIAVLNYDNPLLLTTAQTLGYRPTLTYGLTGGDLHGIFYPPDHLEVEGYSFPVPLPGRHHALNFLGALAVARALGIDWQPFTAGVSVTLPEGRAQRYYLEPDILLLDETYNAGLESMLAALELLQQTPGTRKIAVLGTMKELGDRSLAFHQQVGQRVQQLGLDALCVLVDDPAAEGILQGARGIPQAFFTAHADLITHIQAELRPGDRLLFKASHSVGLNQVVTALTQTSPK
jgi:UDP-N-acetylmuramoyl-tripeptide--D-alanyl-D-alanine ligase